MIHDGEYLANNSIINGAACHSLHHTKFKCNYGQFTTLFDRLSGTYIAPDPELYDKELNRGNWDQKSKVIDENSKELQEVEDPEELEETPSCASQESTEAEDLFTKKEQ